MKIGIKNFRSLKDTGDIDVKPLTILLGKNSSGKSTFLRTFPMLKQSVQEKTISPILLYGNYVDFGSYNDVKPHFNKDNSNYELSFTFNINFLNTKSRVYQRPFLRELKIDDDIDIKFSIEFTENKFQQIQISSLKYVLYDNELIIKLDQFEKKVFEIKINGNKYYDKTDNIYFFDNGEFNIELWGGGTSKESKRINTENFKHYVYFKLISIISKYVTKNTDRSTKDSILRKIRFGSNESILSDIKAVSITKTWSKKVENWDCDSKEFKELRDFLYLFEYANFFSNRINDYLKSVLLNINYIAPLRATAERYYRIQHLAVDEVDQNGKNLPIFLASLTQGQLEDFQNWTLQNFGFKTNIRKIEGHYLIKIVQSDNIEINLSDMGFGYSQILPILTQIWHSTNRKQLRQTHIFYLNNLEKIIAIEQPELHLHPEFQAKFADAISKVINFTKNNNIHLNLIIETHSDIIVNRLGLNILNDTLNTDDVNIILFEKEDEISPSKITISNFDDEGNLTNWPLGFFTPQIK